MKLVKKLGGKVNNLKAKVGVAALMSFASAASFAQTASGIDITAATDAAKTDIAKAGGLIVGVIVAVAAIGWIRRVIK